MSVNLLREQPPSIFMNFALMPCHSMSCSIKKVNCPYIKPLERHTRFGSEADISQHNRCVHFSNRPLGVKRFQTIHHTSVDVAHGFSLLFGIGTEALPAWGPRTKWNNLLDGLASN